VVGPSRSLRLRALSFVAAFVSVLGMGESPPEAEAGGATCPRGMASVHDAFCIDRYEASLVLVTAEGDQPFSPYEMVKGRTVRAVSRPNVTPQAYISRNEADAACKASRKRLCQEAEWVEACEGKRPTAFPYGDDRKSGYCNDEVRTSPLAKLYPDVGGDAYTYEPMNDPRLNQVPGTVAHTGHFSHCKSSYGAYDMVGNVHEWVDDRGPTGGTFLGGYYLDTHINGDGCHYKTVAHDADYHDYSTGFRCCADTKR
jgi:formylglycine-generating enzyme